jgi:EpsI family protein
LGVLFALAWTLVIFNPTRRSLLDALDLDISGICRQAGRLRLIEPSPALIGITLVFASSAIAWQAIPPRPLSIVHRDQFSLFPNKLGNWTVAARQRLSPDIEQVLRADDYLAVTLVRPQTSQPVDLFIAWYKDQMKGGTHSPTVCLPGAGWEISSLHEVQVSKKLGKSAPFVLNRAIIQKGLDRMVVYYWYEQQGTRVASSYYSRFLLAWSKMATGRSDGALVRLITPIAQNESSATADARLQDALYSAIGVVPQFVSGK